MGVLKILKGIVFGSKREDSSLLIKYLLCFVLYQLYRLVIRSYALLEIYRLHVVKFFGSWTKFNFPMLSIWISEVVLRLQIFSKLLGINRHLQNIFQCGIFWGGGVYNRVRDALGTSGDFSRSSISFLLRHRSWYMCTCAYTVSFIIDLLWLNTLNILSVIYIRVFCWFGFGGKHFTKNILNWLRFHGNTEYVYSHIIYKYWLHDRVTRETICPRKLMSTEAKPWLTLVFETISYVTLSCRYTQTMLVASKI